MFETETASVTLEQAWNKAVPILKSRLGDQVFDSWFGSMRVDTEHSTEEAVCLSVANAFLVGRVTQPLYFPTLVDIVRLTMGREVAVRVIARPRGNISVKVQDPQVPYKRPERDIFVVAPRVHVGQANPPPASKVEPKMIRTKAARKPVAKKERPQKLPKPESAKKTAREERAKLPAPSQLDLLVRQLFMKHEQVKIEMLIEMMAQVYKVSVSTLKAHHRFQRLSEPCVIVIYLSKRLISSPHAQISRALGINSGTSIVNTLKKSQREWDNDTVLGRKMKEYVAAIERNRPR